MGRSSAAGLGTLLLIAAVVFGGEEDRLVEQRVADSQPIDDRVALVSIDERSQVRQQLDSAFKLARKVGQGRTAITGLLPSIVEAQLGESEGNAVVIKACDQVTLKLRQDQSAADDDIKGSTSTCATNLDTLQKTLVDQQGQHEQTAERIKTTHATIGNALNSVKESQQRTVALEASNAKLNAQKLQDLQAYEARETDRFKYVNLIQRAVNIMCNLDEYKTTAECSTQLAGETPRVHVRYANGYRGNMAAGTACAIPFTYRGKEYTDCIGTGYGGSGWCSQDSTHTTRWGGCTPPTLNQKQIQVESDRSKSIEPTLAASYSDEAPSEVFLMDDVDFLQVEETEDDNAASAAYEGMVEGEVAKLQQAMRARDVSVASELLQAVLKIKRSIVAQGESDAKKWMDTEHGYRTTIKKAESAVQNEIAAQETARRQVSELEISLKKERSAVAVLTEQMQKSTDALAAERLRCWQAGYEYSTLTRDRKFDLTVLDQLRTLFEDTAPTCAVGCAGEGHSTCVYKESSASTYCACGYEYYGQRCEHTRCPGVAIPAAGEGLTVWKPQPVPASQKARLFEAHDPWACSGHGTCDRRSGKCDASCIPRGHMCEHPNVAIGESAALTAELGSGQLLTIDEAKALCSETAACSAFSFPGAGGTWDQQGVLQADLFDSETGRGTVSFYSNPDATDFVEKQWGGSVYMKEAQCGQQLTCSSSGTTAGPDSVLADGMPSGSMMSISKAKYLCQHTAVCTGFSFPDETGYYDTSGQLQPDYYVQQSQHGRVTFFSRPDTTSLQAPEAGMSMHVKCGPGTHWMDSDTQWMTERASQRSHAGKLTSQCHWGFESRSMAGWTEALQCSRAFESQPISAQSCDESSAGTRTAVSNPESDDRVMNRTLQLMPGGLGFGKLAFEDKEFTIGDVTCPLHENIAGETTLMLRDDAAAVSHTVTFEIDIPSSVYILVDNAVAAAAGGTPEWMNADFVRADGISVAIDGRDSGDQMVAFRSKITYAAGAVSLGPIPPVTATISAAASSSGAAVKVLDSLAVDSVPYSDNDDIKISSVPGDATSYGDLGDYPCIGTAEADLNAAYELTFEVDVASHLYILLHTDATGAESGDPPGWLNDQYERLTDVKFGTTDTKNLIAFKSKTTVTGPVKIEVPKLVDEDAERNIVVVVKPHLTSELVVVKPALCESQGGEGMYFVRSDMVNGVTQTNRTGVLESETFRVSSGSKLSFFVAGGNHSWPAATKDVTDVSCTAGADGVTAVNLEQSVQGKWTVARTATGEDSGDFRSVEWDVSDLGGELLRLRLYDLAVDDKGFIAADGFTVSNCKELNSVNATVAPTNVQIDGGGWELVRRVKPGSKWHPATDHLEGSEVYGKAATEYPQSDLTFSVRFDHKDFDQFLLATGDLSKWMIVSRAEMAQQGTDLEGAVVSSSFDSVSNRKVKWNNRIASAADPYIGLTDQSNATTFGEIMYVGDSYDDTAVQMLEQHNGANVFIRKSGAVGGGATPAEYKAGYTLAAGTQQTYVAVGQSAFLVYDLQSDQYVDRFRLRCTPNSTNNPAHVKVSYSNNSVSGTWFAFGEFDTACPAVTATDSVWFQTNLASVTKAQFWNITLTAASGATEIEVAEIQFHGRKQRPNSALNNFILFSSKELVGHSFQTQPQGYTRELCGTICLADPSCQSFNYDHAAMECSMSHVTHEGLDASFQASATVDFYVKQSIKYSSGDQKACELSTCEGAGRCNQRGICDLKSGTCTCSKAHYGDGCEFTRCPATNGLLFKATNPISCSARGDCIRMSGKCKCRSHYEGKGCEQKKCPQNCRGKDQGTCDSETGKCVCKEGFTGHSCGQRRCPKDCNGKGTCDPNTAKCSCHSGYSGASCVQDQPCRSVIANWWDSFNAEGMSSCPSSTLLTGLYRNSAGCEGLYCIEMARCSLPCAGKNEMNIGRCQNTEWRTSMASEGWSRCPTGFFLQGLFRGACHSLYCLTQARCCEVHDSEWDKCSTASWQQPFADEGWAYASGSLFLTGLYRSGSKANSGSNGINQIKMAAQCSFRKLPQVKFCGDGKRDPDEKCDDGNQQNGDGCSSICNVENGWRCSDSNTPLVVTDVSSSTGAAYKEMAGGMGIGKKLYIDKEYMIKERTLFDNEFTIMTQDADKETDNLEVTFNVNQRVHVWVLLDSKSPSAKSGAVPTWMADKYIRTEHIVAVSGPGAADHFVAFKSKHVISGEVKVGPVTPVLTSSGSNFIVVVTRAVCNEVVPYTKGSAKLVGKMSYQTLESHLNRDSSGKSVCGTDFHVCNFQEATVNGVIHREDLGGGAGWIVGGYSNWDKHRRSMWNGEDSTQCRSWSAPRWYGRWGPYRGRISCVYKRHHSPVACCSNAPDRHEASVKLAPPMTYWSLSTKLDADYRGAAVCGSGGWHVCNFGEATIYGTMKAHTFDVARAWITGSFTTSEKSRRSIWSGTDSTFCKAGQYPSWESKFGPYHGNVHCVGGATEQSVACCKTRMQQPASRYADRIKKVGRSSFWTLQTRLNEDWRGARACGAGFHVCNYQETLAYGTYYHASLGGHAWIVGGYSDTDANRRAIWNGEDSKQCGRERAPLWLDYSGSNKGTWGPYYGMVHCNSYDYRAPAACCANSGFPAAAVGELNMASFATVSTSSSDSGGGAAVVDGSTDYADGKTWTTASPADAAVTFDFGASVEIFKVVLYNHNKEADTDVKDFAIEVSEDNASWRQVTAGSLLDTAGSVPNKAQKFQTMDSGRYWRVRITSVYDSSKSSGLSEVELFKEGGGSDLNFFKKFSAYTISGHTLRTLTSKGRMQCATECTMDQECKAFSYYDADTKCDLHSKNRNVGSAYAENTNTDYYEKMVNKHSSGYCKRGMIDYRGTIAVTKSGLDCQKWTAQEPHEHTHTPSDYPGTGLDDHNYCRNPNGNEQGAWCYTSDKNKRWELCDIPHNPACAVAYAANTRGGGGNHRREPAVRFYSKTAGASLRVESRNAASPAEVYLELRNRNLEEGWGIGMNDDLNLWFCYGRLGTMNKGKCALKIEPDGKVHVLGYAKFYKDGQMQPDDEEQDLGSSADELDLDEREVAHSGLGSNDHQHSAEDISEPTLVPAQDRVSSNAGLDMSEYQHMIASTVESGKEVTSSDMKLDMQVLADEGHSTVQPTAAANSLDSRLDVQPETVVLPESAAPREAVIAAAAARGAAAATVADAALPALQSSARRLASTETMQLSEFESSGDALEQLQLQDTEVSLGESTAAAKADLEVGGSGPQEPAATWFSNDNDCSLRLESRDKENIHPVYYELRNQNLDEGWGVGMATDLKLKIGYGQLGSMADKTTAIEISEDSTKRVTFHNEVHFHRQPRFPSVEVPDFSNKMKVGSVVAIKGGNKANSKYCADEYTRIKCNRNAVGAWEKFTVVSAGDGRIALRGGKNNKLCADEGSNGIKCNRNAIGGWEKFRVVDGGGGKIGLRGGKENKLCADEYYTTVCNRNAVQGWEKFTVECLSDCASTEESRSLEETLGEAQSSNHEHRAAPHEPEHSSNASAVDARVLSLFQSSAQQQQRSSRRRQAWAHRRRRRATTEARRRAPPARRRFTGTLTANTYAEAAIEPAVTYYSSDGDASVRVESREKTSPKEVYLELRNKELGSGWQIGMADDYNLHVGWGSIGNGKGDDALRIDSSGNTHLLGEVVFKSSVVQTYKSNSGIQCVGAAAAIGGPDKWSDYSRCPAGYAVVGLQGVYLHNSQDSHRGKYQDVDHVQCGSSGCRAWCRGDTCDVVARCCKTEGSPLRCVTGEYKSQQSNRWGEPAHCPASYTATGFATLDLHNNKYWKHQMVNDFFCSERYCRAWCWGSNCGVRPRCCKPRHDGQKLQCQAGSRAYGERDQWGAYSKCPMDYTAITHQRVDMMDQQHPNNEVMHKYECNDNGCRAWCWGSACQSWSKCCKVVMRD